MTELQKIDGAILERKNPYLSVIETPSPSMNFVFGKGWGLPRGYSMLLWGAPRGGKSVISNMMIAAALRDYPDAMVVKFDTEGRENLQMTEEDLRKYGIDPNDGRYLVIQTNDPVVIFDTITNKIQPHLQNGDKISLIVIDSISSIRGRRDMNAESLETQQIGDKAKTLQDGLSRILDIQREHDIALIMTAQARGEMDMHMQKLSKVRMDAAYGVKHYTEYYVYVEQGIFKSGRQDLLGNTLDDESVEDLLSVNKGAAERRAHRISVTMIDSSAGPKGRSGEFTFDFRDLKVINQHEEIFLLGTRRGVISKPNNQTYQFGEQTWRGKEAILKAIKDDRHLGVSILNEVKTRDNAGTLAEEKTEEKTEESS